MDLFDSEQFSGIAGTVISDTFTYEVARWLVQRYPKQLSVDWDMDEQGRQMAVSACLAFCPLLADDSLVEADTPYLDWMGTAAGGSGTNPAMAAAAPRRYAADDVAEDGLVRRAKDQRVMEPAALREPTSRTHARRNPQEMYFHRGPLIRRNQVSLEEEMRSPPLPIRKLARREGEEVLDMVRDALTVRYRELYGTTRGDPESVVEADVGRGVHIFLWGLPPDRRLPLRAYYAGITLKNGVPINYIEGISLFEWMEVGFNTFYAFRDGETAWIYSKVLHLLHQLTNVTCFSVYPYQLGDQNEEAIKSGAFWFYRKLGFRPGRPELLATDAARGSEDSQQARTPNIGPHSAQAGRCACVLRVWRRASRTVGQILRTQHRTGCAAAHGREFNGDPERCVAPRAPIWPNPAGGSRNMEPARAIGVQRLRIRLVAGARTERLDGQAEAGADPNHSRQGVWG